MKWDFKLYAPMLASEYDAPKLTFPRIASPKVDGIRAVVALNEGGEPCVFSRSGKPIRNKHIQSVLAQWKFLHFDGELIVGEPNDPDVYNATTRGVMSADGEPEFTFLVFDHQGSAAPYYTRIRELQEHLKEMVPLLHPSIKLHESREVNNMEELEAAEADYLSRGFEGMMIRKPDTLYKNGRSTNKDGALLKVKRFVHSEATVVGFKEQMSNGNDAFRDELGRTARSQAKGGMIPTGMMGAFICRSDEYEETFDVSASPIKLDGRRDMWENRTAFLGQTVRYKHFPHGAKDRPRHANFAGFRDPDDMS